MVTGSKASDDLLWRACGETDRTQHEGNPEVSATRRLTIQKHSKNVKYDRCFQNLSGYTTSAHRQETWLLCKSESSSQQQSADKTKWSRMTLRTACWKRPLLPPNELNAIFLKQMTAYMWWDKKHEKCSNKILYSNTNTQTAHAVKCSG